MAAYLSDKAASISCIDIAAVPFEKVLGESIGKMLQSVSRSFSLAQLAIFISPPPPPLPVVSPLDA